MPGRPERTRALPPPGSGRKSELAKVEVTEMTSVMVSAPQAAVTEDSGWETAGHAIVRVLEEHGVPRAYVVPGESFLEVLDGLHDSTINTVVCRDEGGAAYMAEAEGKLGGLPGVAMVTRGPGAANAFVGVHTAWQDSTAMILFVGLIPSAHREKEAS